MKGRKHSQGASDTESRRSAILRYVQGCPGATIQRVATAFCFTHTTATYHLRALAAGGHLEAKRTGRSVRHYAKDSGDRADLLAPLLRDEKRARILRHFASTNPGGRSINQVAKDIGLTFGIMKSTLVELDALGLVNLEQVHGRFRIYPAPMLGMVLSEALSEDGESISDLTQLAAPMPIP
jgi:predicted transcriptional regulator